MVRRITLLAILITLASMAGCRQCQSYLDYCGPLPEEPCDFLARKNSILSPGGQTGNSTQSRDDEGLQPTPEVVEPSSEEGEPAPERPELDLEEGELVPKMAEPEVDVGPMEPIPESDNQDTEEEPEADGETGEPAADQRDRPAPTAPSLSIVTDPSTSDAWRPRSAGQPRSNGGTIDHGR